MFRQARSASSRCPKPLRLRSRCKAVQAPLQSGETIPSRLDQPAGWIESFLLRTRLIGVHHARGEILSEREAVKTEGSGYLANYQYLQSGLLLRHEVEGSGFAEIGAEL